MGHTALNDRSHKETEMYSPRICGVGGGVGEGEKNSRKQLSDKGDTWRPPDDRWPWYEKLFWMTPPNLQTSKPVQYGKSGVSYGK